jgi:hypothetical protein
MRYRPLPPIYVVPLLSANLAGWSRDEKSEGCAMGAKRDFTDRYLKALKPAEQGKRVIFWDAQVPQFGIRVTDKSQKENVGAFVLVARFPGSSNPAPRRIGDFPAMGLAQARQIAREWREDIAKGVDPKVKEADRRREEDRRRADTFGAVFEAFADDHLSTLRTGDAVRRAVNSHVIVQWGRRPISEIRRANVNELIRALRKDAPDRSKSGAGLFEEVFRMVRRSRYTGSVASGVGQKAGERE